MTDQTGPRPDDEPTNTGSGDQPLAAPPPPPPYGEQPPPPPPPTYGQQPPAYGQQPPAYGQQPPAYGQQHPAFGQQPPAYGQPPYGYGQMPSTQGPAGSPPPNYLVWAILATVFCCLPLGIASIVFAAQVNNKWALGDVAGAHASSRKARQFAIWSAVSAAVIGVLYAILAVAVINNS